MHFSRKQEVFCPIVVGFISTSWQPRIKIYQCFTQTCHFTVCSLRYFKLESSHFMGKEQGIIYRVHLLFPNVKHLKFSLRERYAESRVPLSNQSIFSFQAPTKKIVNEAFNGSSFTSRSSRWASIKGTRKTNEKRERLFCENTLFIAHEAVTLQ